MNSTSSRDQRIRESKRTEREQGHPHVAEEGGPRKKKRGGRKVREKVEVAKIKEDEYVKSRKIEHGIDEDIEVDAVTEVELVEDAMEIEEEYNMLEGLPITLSKPVTTTQQTFLPSWLTAPLLISPRITHSQSSQISLLPLSPSLLSTLDAQSLTHLFPVQLACLQTLLPTQHTTLTTQDLFIKAPTGSGKTLAYILPIVQTLSGRIVQKIRAVVVLPTRDLAAQVKAQFEVYTRGTTLRTILLGGGSVAGERGAIDRGVDIVVATPGRLCEHVLAGVGLSDVRFLVIDEADRLLNQTYQHWVAVVVEACGKEASTGIRSTRIRGYGHGTPLQKMLFSATLTNDPCKIAGLKLERPLFICVDEDGKEDQGERLVLLPDGLREEMFITPAKTKLAALTWLLKRSSGNVLVFVKSVDAAHRLSAFLNIHLPKHITDIGDTPTQAITSNLSRQTRAAYLKDFGQGFRILIATDLLARGIDALVGLVVHYDAPGRVEGYVHRCGRTARAGRSGRAVVVVGKEGVRGVKAVMRGCGRVGKVHKRGMGTFVLGEMDEDAKECEALEGKVREGEGVDACMHGLEESLAALQTLVTGIQAQDDSYDPTYDEYYTHP